LHGRYFCEATDWMCVRSRAMCVSPDKERVTMKKSSRTTRPAQSVEQQPDQLKQLKVEELRNRWQALFDSAPPPRMRSSLIVQAIAGRLQEKALGGVKSSTQRLLQRAAEEAEGGRKISGSGKKAQPRPGTVLVREWHGSKHQVSVLKDGFLYRS